MSPTISAVPAIDPSQDEDFSGCETGTTSATGSPNRVTKIRVFVLRTLSSTERQVALNFEIAISSMGNIVLWSMTMVKSPRAMGAGFPAGCEGQEFEDTDPHGLTTLPQHAIKPSFVPGCARVAWTLLSATFFATRRQNLSDAAKLSTPSSLEVEACSELWRCAPVALIRGQAGPFVHQREVPKHVVILD